MSKKIRAAIVSLFILLFALLSQAIPVPHGVSGYIYELDGVTQVAAGNLFVVNDTTSGFFVTGKTGFGGESGRYVVAINGNDGDSLTVRTWNSLHSASTTFDLSGVMGNINLLLNTTIPVPPVINSIPIISIAEDEAYVYAVIASDRDNDTLSYLIVESPAGMSISLNGTITWFPGQGNIGENAVKVRVDDGTYATYQNFTIDVSNVNDVPSIFSVPVSYIAQNALYEYSIIASDEDGNVLSYQLVVSPPGMVISENNVTWVPANSDVGNNTVIVNVSDGFSFTTQEFIIEVENVNDAPLITSSPILNASEDVLYFYSVSSIDPDNDLLNYTLGVKPEGMNISGSNLSWIPKNEDRGYNNVTVEVSDGNTSAYQTFLVYVANTNDPPVVTSIPSVVAFLGGVYEYAVEATDEDNDTLSFNITLYPDGMAINNATGFIEWKPLGSQRGDNQIVVEVTDGFVRINHSFTISVAPPGRGVSNSGGGGGGGGALAKPDTSIESVQIEAQSEGEITFTVKGSDDISEILLRTNGRKTESARIMAIKERPQGLKAISKRVYKYFDIKISDLDSSEIENAEINFVVDKNWLEENRIEANNIVLNRYAENDWQELSTEVMDDSASRVSYRARTAGFSYFAVSVKNEEPAEEINKNQAPVIVDAPFSSFIVAGQVFEPNGRRQVLAGSQINITNINTSQVFTGNTGVGPYSGGFFIIVNGRIGDRLLFSIEGSKGTRAITLSGDTKDIRIIRRANVLEVNVPGITGFTVFGNPAEVVLRPFAAIIIFVILAGIFIFTRRKAG